MITIRGADNSVLASALELLVAQIKAARKAMEPLHLNTGDLAVLEQQAGAVHKTMNANVGREEWRLETASQPIAAIGVRLLIEKLVKLRSQQLELGVLEPTDTEARLKDAKDLGARLVPKDGSFLDQLANGLKDKMPKGTSASVSDGRRTVEVG